MHWYTTHTQSACCNICRVLYAARSPSDHGPVENSTAAMQADVAVLEAELDIDKLCKQEQ